MDFVYLGVQGLSFQFIHKLINIPNRGIKCFHLLMSAKATTKIMFGMVHHYFACPFRFS